MSRPKKQKEPHALAPRLESELAVTEVIPPQNELYTTIYHAVNPGDLVAAMGAIKKYYDVTSRRCKVVQSVTQQAAYYQGAVHPTVDKNGVNVCVNEPVFAMLKPLIESQYYIHSMEVYQGQKLDLDFNIIRGKTYVNMPHGTIQGWIPIAFPDLQFNISNPWMFIEGDCPARIKEQVGGRIILNFTERYRNTNIDYTFLQHYAPDLIFAGTAQEHWVFCNKWGLSIPYLQVNDFLEYAYAIRECRYFLGNQSLGWNLCQAVGKPRILEMCSFADNCFPGIGENSEGYFYQVGAEYSFRSFYKKFK